MMMKTIRFDVKQTDGQSDDMRSLIKTLPQKIEIKNFQRIQIIKIFNCNVEQLTNSIFNMDITKTIL